MNFSEKSCKKWLVSWKTMKNHRFNQNWQLFEQTITFRGFDEVFRKKLEKVAHFVKNGEKSSIWQKPATFQANYHVSRFPRNFWTEVGKSGSFREKPWKIIDLAKTGNFSSTLSPFEVSMNFSEKKISKSGSFHEKPRDSIDLAKTGNFWSKLLPFEVSMKFSEKSWKKSLTSWKTAKNHRFGKNLQPSKQTITFRGFHEIFGQKLEKVAPFVRNHEKSSIWPKLATFRAHYHLSRFPWTFRRKKFQKVVHFMKNLEIPSIWQKLATFGANYYLSRFRWSFQKKVGKSRSLREKRRKIIDLAKTCNLPSKLSRFEVSTKFLDRSWKKWLLSWETMKNHRFGQNWQLFENTITFRGSHELFGEKNFKNWLISWKTSRYHRFGKNWQLLEQTITFRGFDEVFRKKLEKVAHFVKNGEKSSIWQKPATFQANYHVSRFPWNFWTEVGKSGSFREKPWKIIDLAKTGNFSSTLSPFEVSMNFSEKKISKRGSFHEKPRDSIDLAKTGNFWSKLLPFEVSMNFSEKSCKKWLISWKILKNHRSNENWQLFEQTITFPGFDELFGEMLEKVAHFVKNHEKFGQNWELFEQTITLRGLDELFGKKLQKVAHFEKKHDTSSIWPKLETFRTNYDVSRFGWTFRKKVAKLAHFVKNHEKPSI